MASVQKETADQVKSTALPSNLLVAQPPHPKMQDGEDNQNKQNHSSTSVCTKSDIVDTKPDGGATTSEPSDVNAASCSVETNKVS